MKSKVTVDYKSKCTPLPSIGKYTMINVKAREAVCPVRPDFHKTLNIRWKNSHGDLVTASENSVPVSREMIFDMNDVLCASNNSAGTPAVSLLFREKPVRPDQDHVPENFLQSSVVEGSST